MSPTHHVPTTFAYLSGLLGTLLACGFGNGVTASGDPATAPNALRAAAQRVTNTANSSVKINGRNTISWLTNE